MNFGSLVERIEHGAIADPAMAPAAAHQLDDVARALRAVTDRNSRTMRIKEAKQRIEKPVAANDTEPALPQILQHPVSSLEPTSRHKQDGHRGVVAPTILAFALLGVGVLMSASLWDASRLPGLGWLDDKPRPRLASQATLVTGLATTLDADTLAAATPPDTPVQGPPISLDELELLESCEKLIAAGDMPAARQTLARAASNGSVNARFALAETFDPNVLAAWGLRDRVADVGTARTLYEQAMTAGDPRAAVRIAALDAHK